MYKVLVASALAVAALGDTCSNLYKQAGLSSNFNESIAHSIHSMNTIGLKYFNNLATENNGIPTVNHDLRESDKVINYAPNEELLDDYTTFTMQVIDTILSKIGNDDDGLGSNWSPTERIVHKFHMYDLWKTIQNYWEINIKNTGKAPSDSLCSCLKDVKNNGIYDAVAWVANHYESGTPITLLNRAIPKLEDSESWKVWKQRLLYYYTDDYLYDASLYIDCVQRDFSV